jgi:transcriptional regulator NrdR family protein
MSGTSGGCGWRGTHRQRCRNAGRRSLGATEASPGAYVRFASVYRSFEDVDDFRALVDEVKR